MLTRVRAFAHIRAGARGIGNFPGDVNGAQAQTQSLQAQLQILQQLQMLQQQQQQQQTQVATLKTCFCFCFFVFGVLSQGEDSARTEAVISG